MGDRNSAAMQIVKINKSNQTPTAVIAVIEYRFRSVQNDEWSKL